MRFSPQYAPPQTCRSYAKISCSTPSKSRKARRWAQIASAALGLDALIETHDAKELERAIKLGSTLIGINNRDLRTFDTTLDTFVKLAPKTPKNCTLIAESGIFTRDDIIRLAENGAQGYLIGESLMRQEDVEEAVRALS